MKPQFEQRLLEVRAIGEDPEVMEIEGRAIVYNRPATQKNGRRSFTEVINRGALDKTNMKDVVMRYNHKDNFIIMARTRNRSLKLTVDSQGLYVNATLLDTQQNRDIYRSIKEGLIDKMSFAFRVADGGDKWAFGENETHREINNIELLRDVSVVDTPFYDDTSITARSFDLLDSEKERLDSLAELERQKIKTQIRSKL